jgi:hypothetical protein
VSPRNKWLSIKDQGKRPTVTFKVLAFGIIYGIIIGYFGYFFGEEILFRVIGIVVIWSIIKFMIKDTLKNAIIIHAMILSVLVVTQGAITFPLDLIDRVNISFTYTTVISQLFGLIIVLLFYKKISLHKLYVFIKSRLGGINFLLLMVFAVTISIAYFVRDSYSTYSLTIMLISVVNIIACYKFIIHNQKLSSKFHHTSSVYEGVDYLLKTENNLQKIQKQYADTLEKIEFEIPESNFKPGQHKENIIEFIENKKTEQNAKMRIVKNINYHWENRTVSSPMIIYMLGTLLNNAFETKRKKPLFVDISVAGHVVEITVSNASDNKSFIEIAQMFDTGSSSKKGNRGYGLPNLLKIVNSYNGDIAINCDYKPEYKSHYLTLTIRIKEFK